MRVPPRCDKVQHGGGRLRPLTRSLKAKTVSKKKRTTRETYYSSRAGSCPRKDWSSGCLCELGLDAELAYCGGKDGASSTLAFLPGRRGDRSRSLLSRAPAPSEPPTIGRGRPLTPEPPAPEPGSGLRRLLRQAARLWSGGAKPLWGPIRRPSHRLTCPCPGAYSPSLPSFEFG